MNEKELVRYFYEVVVTENRLNELPQFISENCTGRAGENVFHSGPAGMKQHLLSLRQTYPDVAVKVIRQYQDGNVVISEVVMTGTHSGEFLGITPTHEVLEINGVNIDTVSDGKIVEHAGAANTFDTFFEHHLIKPV